MANALREVLGAAPHQDKRQLLSALRQRRLTGLTTTDVNSVLYERRGWFASDGGTPPLWRLAASLAKTSAPVQTATGTFETPHSYVGFEPRAWQREALAAWLSAGRRGVVEAVTGTGKTVVGVLAAAAAVDAGEKVLVLVPGRELLDQWFHVLTRDVPKASIGCFSGSEKGDFRVHDVLVATVQSASKWQMLTPGMRGLLVADEVHRYGAETFSLALEPGFDARLGLTATYAREDDGVAKHLEPYFGPVVAGCDYERGLADGILARFRVGLIGVDFTPGEQERHDEYDEQARGLRRRLIVDHGCPEQPFGEFMAAVNRLSQGGIDHSQATKRARHYLNAFSKRRQVLAGCRSKYAALADLAPLLASAQRGLVFTETTESAREAAEVLRQEGVLAQEFTSNLRHWERQSRLNKFKTGSIRVLASARVLDEGIDVPEADVGVILAASRSKRQMIQRMGRVIRPKKDYRPATFVVTYVRGTAEDPANGAHNEFLELLTEVAEETKYFDRATAAELMTWHQGGRQ